MRATKDIKEGVASTDLWMMLGWNELRQRYRRSVLGPFWLTLSMAIMVGALGFLYSGIFKQELSIYLPYLGAGIISWGLISSLVVEGCYIFISGSGIIKQVRVPLSIHIYQHVWKSGIVFLHNIVIMLLIIPLFGVSVNSNTLYVILALIVYWINGVWVGMLLGLLSARFRDIPMLVASAMQVLFFFTPIVWFPELIPDRAYVVDLNPFHHFIEILRQPMLGGAAEPLSWVVVGVVSAVGVLVALPMFIRYRERIAFWV
jgi:ABC-2 type transport system permease protein/lipopolysaccharide transport system permease protein